MLPTAHKSEEREADLLAVLWLPSRAGTQLDFPAK